MGAIRVITKVVYCLFGTFFVLVGGSAVLFNTGLLPEVARNMIIDYAQGDGRLLHVIQEWGNAHLLLGLLTFWFVRHYDRSQAYHWAMTAYFAVDALIHWFDVSGSPVSMTGPLVNTIPLIVFVTLGLLRGVKVGPAAERSVRGGTSEDRQDE